MSYQALCTRIIGIIIDNFELKRKVADDGYPHNVPSIYYFYHLNNNGKKEESNKQILYIDPSSLNPPTIKFLTNISASGNILTDSDINCSEITATNNLKVGNSVGDSAQYIQITPTSITSNKKDSFSIKNVNSIQIGAMTINPNTEKCTFRTDGANNASSSKVFSFNAEVSAPSFNASNSDFSEFFEWSDGNKQNEDRIGYFVSLVNGNKIEISNKNVIGIITGTASYIGNNPIEWHGKYKIDEFGRKISETELNPLYDSEQEYISRSKRKEWGNVGLLGQIHVRDDGTCIPGGFCKVNKNGIATLAKSKKYNTYNILRRISNNVIEVLFK